MSNPSESGTSARLVLAADTARDLMEPSPVSISNQASLTEAIEFLTNKGFSAAPVIDDAGRPVGVISQTNLVLHMREQDQEKVPEYYGNAGLAVPQATRLEDTGKPLLVQDIMTPAVFSVTPETPARNVVEHMLALAVHRVFVVDRTGILLGVISAIDLLRRLK